MTPQNDIRQVLEKYVKGKCTREELDSVLDLLADPLRRSELRPVLTEFWEKETWLAGDADRGEDFEEMLNQIHHRINTRHITPLRISLRKRMLTFSKIAAILVLGFLLGILIPWLKTEDTLYCTSVAPKGSVSQLVLPDQTIIFLNAGSEIKYPAGNKKGIREVYLKGEAWFDVTTNKNKPFMVFTPFYNARVLGTKFNIKAYENETEIATTLEEGSVQILSSENLKMKDQITLKPGEQLIYNQPNNAISVRRVNTRLYTSWKDNKLIFINMNVKDLIVLLERKYGVDIEVTDNVVLDYHYDGTIRDETILEVLDLLKETLQIRYKIEGQTIFITKK
jgi:ferric-dicitrate binding protein FerR (iron transport regulator)